MRARPIGDRGERQWRRIGGPHMTFDGVKQIAENRPQFGLTRRFPGSVPLPEKKLMIAVIADLSCGSWS
jgi:hypothetical protein